MARKTSLMFNIEILQRNLTTLRDLLYREQISKGQERFVMVYLEGIQEFIDKSVGILNRDKYLEELTLLDE
jgi:hypothetical protein